MVNFFIPFYKICFLTFIIVKRRGGIVLVRGDNERTVLDSLCMNPLHIELTSIGPDS